MARQRVKLLRLDRTNADPALRTKANHRLGSDLSVSSHSKGRALVGGLWSKPAPTCAHSRFPDHFTDCPRQAKVARTFRYAHALKEDVLAAMEAADFLDTPEMGRQRQSKPPE